MLVLSRKIGQSLSIDDGRIEVKVVAIRGDRIRLGIVAPKDVRVVRSELDGGVESCGGASESDGAAA